MYSENLDAEKNRYKATQLIKFIEIPAGQSISPIIDCGGVQLRGLFFPQNWTACNVSFYSSPGQNVDGSYTTFLKTDFDGTALVIPTTPSQDLPIIAAHFDYTKYFQLALSANQVNLVRIIAVFQPIYQGIHA